MSWQCGMCERGPRNSIEMCVYSGCRFKNMHYRRHMCGCGCAGGWSRRLVSDAKNAPPSATPDSTHTHRSGITLIIINIMKWTYASAIIITMLCCANRQIARNRMRMALNDFSLESIVFDVISNTPLRSCSMHATQDDQPWLRNQIRLWTTTFVHIRTEINADDSSFVQWIACAVCETSASTHTGAWKIDKHEKMKSHIL